MKKLMMILIVLAITGIGLTATLVWEPSPTEGVTGYNIYFGSGWGSLTKIADVGNVLEWPVDLEPGIYAATAYMPDPDEEGKLLESRYSDGLLVTELVSFEITAEAKYGLYEWDENQQKWLDVTHGRSGRYRVLVSKQIAAPDRVEPPTGVETGE